jgi:thiamine biosynthesis lipoprotein
MLTRRELLKWAPPNVPIERDFVHLSRLAMACCFELTLPAAEHAGLAIARRALAEVDLYEQELTIFSETSEISHINRNAALRPVPVRPSLFNLLLRCQELTRDTQGAFDITSGPLSDCWGFLKRAGRLPQAHEIDAARSLVGPDLVLLDPASRTVRFRRAGVRLNLGSIGKGYAIDCIAASMYPGVRAALLSAGSSSLRAIGTGNHRSGWTVGVRHPSRPGGRLAVLMMRDCAMATSGCEEQFFEHNGVRYGHIIDPRSGQPADHVLSATVVAPSAAVADALATAFYVAGPQMAQQYCSAHPGVLAIILTSGAARPLVIGGSPRCEVEIQGE